MRCTGSPSRLPAAGCVEADLRPRLRLAMTLIELGDFAEAEQELAGLQGPDPLALRARLEHVRGELTRVVELWAQEAGRAPAFEPLVSPAWRGLLALERLASDPAGSSRDLVALAEREGARTPAAWVELGLALRLLATGSPVEAVAHARWVGRRHAEADPSVRRLGALVEARVAERTGDLAGACAVLEALGAERGHEEDLDRVLTLAALYEARDDPEALRSAIRFSLIMSASEAPSTKKLRRTGNININMNLQ